MRTVDGQARATGGHVAAARTIAAGVAAGNADDVDRRSRFPAEAVQALREQRLLAACAAAELGGLSCSARELATIAQALAQGCAATAMTWAMHQIQLACLAHHGHSDYLRRFTARVCGEQLLLSSATSEVGIGGDIGTSRAAVTPADGRLAVDKEASAVSYGAHCDAILATFRRHPAAAPNDQVLVVLLADETTIEQRSAWDALGMRGTCSAGFRVRSAVRPEQILPDPFAQIATDTMVPYSHLLWSACWIGIAAAAADRARSFLRQRERKSPGSTGSAVTRLARAFTDLQLADTLVADVADALDRGGGTLPEHWRSALTLNTVKVSVSEIAVRITQDCLDICGFAGYQERGPFSVARQLRDVLSAPLMLANERLLSTNGGLLLTRKEDHRPW